MGPIIHENDHRFNIPALYVIHISLGNPTNHIWVPISDEFHSIPLTYGILHIMLPL